MGADNSGQCHRNWLSMGRREHSHKWVGWSAWREPSCCLAGAQGQGRVTHIFGGLAEDITHATTIAQSMVHDGNDAHEQSVTGPLSAVWLLVLCGWSVCSDLGCPFCPIPSCRCPSLTF